MVGKNFKFIELKLLVNAFTSQKLNKLFTQAILSPSFSSSLPKQKGIIHPSQTAFFQKCIFPSRKRRGQELSSIMTDMEIKQTVQIYNSVVI